ncbi:Asp-tRNA(Asn)/Glu-tRNA(Gln) amidotransferase subunit GatC [Legionella fairfieldensis]|uniref:Asp-tRNA(Asn)/Glu-tRNA(Gln) amidotransferase subunit GatC n=1 Tax=Legionella fairfieldensis TaxID=45064 RepID=UPI00049138C4|nr:Asp-tRNA(Asn)/Glu-tRNA(Gln) amidotransferase subunit GatC [Legionella fairfieldensis]
MTAGKNNFTLETVASLAYLDDEPENTAQLAEEINAILDFVGKLRQLDTKEVAPLFHPLDLHQPLRADVISENDCIEQLEEISPLFEDGFYLVPKVIE